MPALRDVKENFLLYKKFLSKSKSESDIVF